MARGKITHLLFVFRMTWLRKQEVIPAIRIGDRKYE